MYVFVYVRMYVLYEYYRKKLLKSKFFRVAF
jgi:hypothetical protein